MQQAAGRGQSRQLFHRVDVPGDLAAITGLAVRPVGIGLEVRDDPLARFEKREVDDAFKNASALCA